MKTKTLRFIILLLCFLMILPSCDMNMPDESDSDSVAISTEKETEKETQKRTEKETETAPEWAQMEYWDTGDAAPDLESVDYSKLQFCTDIVTYSNDLELKISKLSDVRTMKELVEANRNEWKRVTSYHEALDLLEEIVADSKNTESAFMLIMDYTEFPDIYAVNTRWKSWTEFELNGGEKQIVLFYSKEWIEGGFTPSTEKLMEAFERYTRYSKVTSVVISAVPIPAEN
ncbi:MAG: hypothetical protein IJY39_11250 [Clostridia bacterium]|nr:hypothetical protein [Clostridia bacterium]